MPDRAATGSPSSGGKTDKTQAGYKKPSAQNEMKPLNAVGRSPPPQQQHPITVLDEDSSSRMPNPSAPFSSWTGQTDSVTEHTRQAHQAHQRFGRDCEPTQCMCRYAYEFGIVPTRYLHLRRFRVPRTLRGFSGHFVPSWDMYFVTAC